MLIATALLALSSGVPGGFPGPAPQETLEPEQVRSRVMPSAEELRYEEIPWIPQFGAGLVRANEDRRPLLFWAMNGHPLGCT